MSLVQRSTLIAAAAAAYLVGLWPTWQLRDFVLQAFGNPPYEGVWILIPHVFLYSTLPALFCIAAWSVLAHAGWMPALRLSFRLRTLGWGLGVGLVSIAVLVAFFFASGQASAFHAPHVDPWLATANVFSNFYEEYVFRGFILVALTAALGFWPAAILSSLAFGATHAQYPLALQALIAGLALLWAWAGERGGGLLAAYTAHMTLDWLIDPIL
ncbi:MAG TPA: type II CAAX endopeptidase family protein [Vitreimonas sp.]|uniref:CPBP family intramembrane glutamic endopeptidase n=1 Tax=Vitreimonas sp. TaxID=3069702 RepID=UPI002D63B9CF|nr:type II CAAX endopeptidase family protein [Vitreimonas sp.]HYD87211.1 type II CAAX endopeptidase family protein [Vitreimonas sp.]